MKHILIPFIVAFLALCVSSTHAQIAPGTSIRISIMGVPGEEKSRIDGNYPVSDSGTINLPFIGRMKVSGMNPDNLASSLQAAYQRAEIYTNPTIHVVSTQEGGEVLAQVVHLGGRIAKRGPIPYKNTLTLWQAVQTAGGPDEFGSMKRVKLFRNGQSQVYNLTNPQFMNVLLKPDDVIEIPMKTLFE